MTQLMGGRSATGFRSAGDGHPDRPRLEAVVEATGELVVVIDAGGTITWTGPQLKAVLGYPPGSRVGTAFVELIHPDDAPAARAAVSGGNRIGGAEPGPPVRARVRHGEGHWVSVEVRTGNTEADPGVNGVVVTIRDISDRVAVEGDLERERSFVEAVLDTAGALVVVMTPNGYIVRFNRAAEQLTGYAAAEVVDRSFEMFLVPAEARVVAEILDDLRSGRYPAVHENDWVTRTGERRTIHWTNTALASESGEIEFLIATGIDVTVERAAQRELARRATHDPLTALPNRALLLSRLGGSLERMARDGGAVGVLFVDLDHFKDVNDRYGHAVGDRLLTAVAGRLRGAVRPEDMVARLGGDEFVVLCADLDVSGMDRLAGRVDAVFGNPVRVGEHVLPLAASIGSARTDDPMQRPQALIDQADRRMYQAKRSSETDGGASPPDGAHPLPPVPPDEADRLAELDDLGVLDVEPVPELHGLLRLATYLCESPLGAITLITDTEQRSCAAIGIDAETVPRATAFCAHALSDPGPLVVPDTLSDERFRTLPQVTGEPGIRFYAGAPLRTAAGHVLGTLCVMDVVPRRLPSDQITALEALAGQVVSHLVHTVPG